MFTPTYWTIIVMPCKRKSKKKTQSQKISTSTKNEPLPLEEEKSHIFSDQHNQATTIRPASPIPRESWETLVQKIECTEVDPGIAIEYADDAILHQILALPNSLLPQGVNASSSGVAFRAWIVGIITGIHPNSAVSLFAGGFSNAHFQHLTMPEYNAIINMIGGLAAVPWLNDCVINGLSAGRFICVTNGGRGFNAMDAIQVLGPFNCI